MTGQARPDGPEFKRMGETMQDPKTEVRRPYETPEVATVDARTIIERLGPALALYGSPLGGTAP